MSVSGQTHTLVDAKQDEMMIKYEKRIQISLIICLIIRAGIYLSLIILLILRHGHSISSIIAQFISGLGFALDCLGIFCLKNKIYYYIFKIYCRIMLAFGILNLFVNYENRQQWILQRVLVLIHILVLILTVMTSIGIFRTTQLIDILYSDKNNINQTPKELKGVFYIENNPAREECIVLENSKYDSDTHSMWINGTGTFSRTFAYKNGCFNACFRSACICTNYRMTFNSELSTGNVRGYICQFIPLPFCCYSGNISRLDDNGSKWDGIINCCYKKYNSKIIKIFSYDNDGNRIEINGSYQNSMNKYNYMYTI